MGDPETTAVPPSEKLHDGQDEATLQRQRSIEQTTDETIDEGRGAETPLNVGHVLDELDDRKRRQSIAEQKLQPLNEIQNSPEQSDLEKGAYLDQKPPIAEASGHDEEATLASEDEANVVFWDGPDDPANPYNWPTSTKVLNCVFISLLTFFAPLGSSIFSPGVPQLMQEFGSSNDELAAFVVSVYVLGFAFGPLLIAPLSEIYGRLILYHACNVGFIAFVLGCALAPSLNALIVFRFFSGLFGSCPLTNGGGTIADMITQEHRGVAMAAFSIGPLMGPVIGPVAGGFLADAKGWRWVFWLLLILSGTLALAMLVFARESYAPVLLQRKVDRLRKETGNGLLRSKLDAGLSPRDYFSRNIIRPSRLLLFSPICTIFAVYIAVVYGYLYLMFTSITEVFEENYGFSTGTVGLVFLGLGFGSLVGLVFLSVTSDRFIKAQAAKAGGEMKPEYRLAVLPVGSIFLPIGFFIYGWTAQYHVHWIVPIIGHAFM
jgi:multidrug resistance protein